MSVLSKAFDTDPLIGTVYNKARADFARFVEDIKNGNDVDKAQCDLAAWQAKHYGIPSDPEMACGVIEEMTETFLADDSAEEALDGLGDTIVYASQLATANRLAIAPIIDLGRVLQHRAGSRPVAGAGVLAQVALKGAQKIRGLGDRDIYRRRLVGALALCIAKALDDVEILHPETIPVKADRVFVIVANEVLARDTGHPSIPSTFDQSSGAQLDADVKLRDVERNDRKIESAAQKAERKNSALAAFQGAAEGADEPEPGETVH